MPFDCRGTRCLTPRWMSRMLAAAGVYHLLFGVWVNLWPHFCFDWAGIDRPNHPALWRGLGLVSAACGIGLLIAARSPVRHWPLVLMGFLKSNLVLGVSAFSLFDGSLPRKVALLVTLDDLIWWFPLAAILWAAVQARCGRPPSREAPLSLAEAGENYHLSTGESLAEASRGQTLAMVFLRHFGCTFTRQILRHLESLKLEAERNGSRLVLVHMLEEGRENPYLADPSHIARIADPRCELYRSFGLGKGGFFELFGPRVWLPLSISLIKGCGMGHLAGDGLQMPGAFLFRDGRILSAQRARTPALLPDIPGLFEELPAAIASGSHPA